MADESLLFHPIDERNRTHWREWLQVSFSLWPKLRQILVGTRDGQSKVLLYGGRHVVGIGWHKCSQRGLRVSKRLGDLYLSAVTPSQHQKLWWRNGKLVVRPSMIAVPELHQGDLLEFCDQFYERRSLGGDGQDEHADQCPYPTRSGSTLRQPRT